MCEISIPISEQEKFRRWTQRVSAETKRDLVQLVAQKSVRMVKYLTHRSPVKYGVLRNSWQINYRQDRLGSAIISTVNYGQFVEFGTRPHIIRAKNVKALHWIGVKIGPRGGKGKRSMFARSVRHPGTRPRPFFYPTFNIIKREFIVGLNKLGFR